MSSQDSLGGSTFTNDDSAALATVLTLLGKQAAANNTPALEFSRKLEALESTLQSLDLHMQSNYSNGIFDLLSSPAAHD